MRCFALCLILLLPACVGGVASRTVVQGTGGELLKLRAGPGLGYNVILGLPDETQLVRRNCVMESMQTWCRVSLADAPSITGYVAEDYLAER